MKLPFPTNKILIFIRWNYYLLQTKYPFPINEGLKCIKKKIRLLVFF